MPLKLKTALRFIEEHIEDSDLNPVKKMFEHLRAVDIADIIDNIDEDYRIQAFNLLCELDLFKAADVLGELEEAIIIEIIEALPSERLSSLVEKMPSDEAADVVLELSKERAGIILKLIPRKESEDVAKLLKYKEDSAGGIMTTEVVSFHENTSVTETIEKIREMDLNESFYNIFVVNDSFSLVGKVPINRLILTSGNPQLIEIMDKNILTVHPDIDQEEVASLVAKYNLLSLPVVDKNNRLLGRIMVDDIIDVINEEATEDIYRMAGTNDEELLNKSILSVASIRLPWLLITMCGGMATCFLMKSFQATLHAYLALAFFIPIIMGMGGNIGIQSSAIVIRGIATGAIDGSGLLKVFLKEIGVGMVMGTACGILVGLVSIAVSGPSFLGIIVGISMFSAITTAATIGTLAPLVFRRINIDPAVASGPFVTTANDITGLVIYFSLATALLKYLTA